jgi:hypothetical protein
VPAGWDQVPAAYLALGDTYPAERGEAARRGWPVNTLAGAHLHQLIDPAVVAAEITTLMGRCGIDPLNQQRQPANRKRPEPGRGHSTADRLAARDITTRAERQARREHSAQRWPARRH